MKTVHFLAYPKSGLMGNAIGWQTRGKYSHIAIWINDTIYEAVQFKGVIKRKWLDDHDILADAYRLNVNADQFNILLKFLEEQVGKPYDYKMVLRFVSRRQADWRSYGNWFCSEYGFAAARKAGISLLARTEAWEVSPNLFVKSPLLLEEPRV